MSESWAIGGECKDTGFDVLAPGVKLERYGPFASHEAVRKEWRARAMATVDNALIRYLIIPAEALRLVDRDTPSA
jgi:hypothetical protein